MRRAQWLAVGLVTRPHGVKGKIRVTPLAHEIEFFSHLKEVLLGAGLEGARPFKVVKVQYMSSSVLLQLEGLDLQGAQSAVGSFVWARRESLPELGEDEYYWEDLIGLEVVDVSGKLLGSVMGLLETGDSQVLICNGDKGEILVPFVHGIVRELNEEQGKIVVDIPEGLEATWSSTS